MKTQKIHLDFSLSGIALWLLRPELLKNLIPAKRNNKRVKNNPLTIRDIKAIKKYAHLTDPEAETLLNQLKDYAQMIYTFFTKQQRA